MNGRQRTGRGHSRRRPAVSGSAVYGSSQMRAKQRRRKRVRRQRMIFLTMLLVVVLAVGGIVFGAVRGIKTKEKQKLLAEGIAQLDSGSYEAAIQIFEEELKVANGRVGALEEQVLLYRAEAEYQLQDYEAALHTYEILLNEDPKNALYQQGTALCRMETGDYAGALELGVMDAQVYNQMAKEQIESGQYDEALASIELGLAACAQQGASAQAGTGQGGSGQNGAGQQESVALVKRHLQFQQAVAYEYQSDYKKALELFEAYVQQYGDDETAQREITFLKTRQGNH